MKRRIALAAATLSSVAMLAVAAAPAQAEITGPQAFYFTATCSGIDDVLLVNATRGNNAMLQVVGTNTIVLVGSSPSGSPGIQTRATAAGTTCTFTGFGPSPDQLEPVDPPLTLPVVIVNG
jgi:hypothetical protein